MALSSGDKVKNKYNIEGGMLGTSIPSGTKGKIVRVSFVFNKATVEFEVHGRKVEKSDIDLGDIEKA